MPRSPIRLLLADPLSFGPGKAELLEHIARTGSLQAAANAMDMSYMKAWKMVKGLNSMFAEPLVILHRGGKAQGGTEITDNGHRILALYHEAVRSAENAVAPVLDRMKALLPPDETDSSK